MANVKKCPLCGGDVINNYCFSCGIDLPDEEELIAKTDPEPIRTNRTVKTAEPKNYRENYPNIKVAEEHFNQNQHQEFDTSSNNQNDYYNNQNQNYNSSHRPSAFENWAENYSHLKFGDKLRRYWWYILLIALLPGAWSIAALTGFIIMVSQTSRAAKRFAVEQFILAVAALFILF
jgi:hypothetical protein